MCTNINIKSTAGNTYWARTMDFPINPFEYGCVVSTVPKNHQMEAESGTWTSKYAYMGINLSNSYCFFDGVNEVGLVGGLLYLEECSWSTREELQKRNLKPLFGEEALAWALSQYSTVEEVSEGMRQFGLVDEPLAVLAERNPDMNKPTTLHYTFTDMTGHSIVLEPTDNGAFRIFDNTIGVMTNSPTYDWHMTNLRNYIELSDHNRGTKKLGANMAIPQIESGSGLLGLPGDFTSPSRFIRAVYLSRFMDTPTDNEAITALYNLFNTAQIASGWEKLSDTASDFTSYWSGYDTKSQTLYIKPYDTSTFSRICLADTDKTEVQTFEINHTSQFADIAK